MVDVLVFNNLVQFYLIFRHYGIPDNHRILDARKGPVKKTAAVKILPKIQQNHALPSSADSALVDKKHKHRSSINKSIDTLVSEEKNGRMGAATH